MNHSILISHPLAYTLGLTLLHSFWQGAIIAALLAVLLHLHRESAARLRYALGVAAMLIWLGMAAGTFGFLLGFSTPDLTAVRYIEAGTADTFSLSGMIESRMDPAVVLPWFMLFWLSGVLLMSLRTAAGLFGVARLKRHGVAPLPGPWQEKIDGWFTAWDVRQRIPIILSQYVQAPVVAGFFKQTLLLPISFLTAFPPQQIEAILAHEAAHILRRDALINLLQSFMETLFFYHPAIWWISGRIRDEREYSCDDYAVAKCGCAMSLARALVDMQERRADGIMPVPVLSATGRLQTRIMRLFDRKENSMAMREKLLALLMLIGLGLVLIPLEGIGKNSALAALNQMDDPKHKVEKIEVRVVKSGDEEKTFTITTSDTSTEEKGRMVIVKVVDADEDSTLEHGMEECDKIITLNADGDSLSKKILVRVREGGKEGTLVTSDSLHKEVIVLHGPDHVKMIKKEHGSAGKMIKAQLAKDGFEVEKAPVEFRLTDKELYINGVKQPEEAYKKYRQLVSQSLDLGEDSKVEIKLKFDQKNKK